jgi:hypothetical protein
MTQKYQCKYINVYMHLIPIMFRKEFIISYLMIQEKIKLKRVKISRSVDDYNEAEERVRSDLEAVKNEKTNRAGIADNARLILTVVSANITQYDSEITTFASVQLENSIEYQTIAKESTNNPIWNEKFEFPVDSLDNYLKIVIRDKKTIYGRCSILLREFQNQLRIEEAYPIKSDNGTEIGKVLIKAQVFWSMYVYYKRIYDRVVSRLTEHEETLGLLNKYCEKLKEPFGILLSNDIDEIIDKKLTELEQIDLASSRTSLFPGARLSIANSTKLKSLFSSSIEDTRKNCKYIVL